MKVNDPSSKLPSRPLLDAISAPEDLARLSTSTLPDLAQEIRQELLSVISRTGGHLASNLGVVELTIALLRSFPPPRDKVILDTGHQGYVYKLLTGRRELFQSLRQDDGCCGFLHREESPYDQFGAGHAGTAISAALGFAAARDKLGTSEKVVAMVGDGSMGNGISLEGLNNIIESTHDFVLVLNDNKMSIGENVGALSHYLNRMISGPGYNRVKDVTAKAVDTIPVVGHRMRQGIKRVIEGTKSIVLPGALFEDFGLRYIGPIDGHDLEELVLTFERVASLREPVLVHVLTEKGHGYKFASEAPEVYHGAGQFDTSSGLPVNTDDSHPPPVSFSNAFGDSLGKLMKQNSRTIAITAGMCKNTGMDDIRKTYPDRFYDVGIAEAHAVVFAGGLAAAEMRPVVAIYATFMHRAVDCVMHDICLQNLPVLFCLDRSGIVQDGPTHHGIHDLAYWLSMPNLHIMQPADALELDQMMNLGFQTGKPTIIRYPKGAAAPVPHCPREKIELGKAQTVRTGDQVSIWCLGRETARGLQIARELHKQGISAAVVNVRFVRPLDTALLEKQAQTMPIVTLEDHSLQGGLGDLVSLHLSRCGFAPCLTFGWPADIFIPHGSNQGLREKFGLTNAKMSEKIAGFVTHEKL